MQKRLPSYGRLAKELYQDEKTLLPAQIHGYVCGVICGSCGQDNNIQFQLIYDYLKEEGLEAEAGKELLAKLMILSFQQLEDSEYDFQLLLPEDDEQLDVRVSALGKWCGAFLSGLGFSGFNAQAEKKSELSEALQDIAEIAKVKFDDQLAKNEAENSYNELVEYVRVAVMLIYTQITNGQRSGSAKTVH